MEHLEKFLKNYPAKSFSKGQIILVEGEAPAAVYVIKRGVVETYNLTSEGQEKPISFDVRGEIFPVDWAFSKVQRTLYYHEAFTDCELYAVPRADLLNFVQSNQGALYELFDYFVNRHLNYQMRVNALEQSKAADKVLYTLHFLCLRFGRGVRPDVIRIQLPLTHQDLANFMGLTRETTGIELKKLEKAGVITYKRQNYIVKIDKLNELLDTDYGEAWSDKADLEI